MLSVFNIIGPIMIGPSSSHTSGAASLGLFAKRLFGSPVTSVDILLHGSFADVYKGHMTDRALVAGILGMKCDDTNLITSFEKAHEAGVKYKIIPTTLGLGYHPNSVKFSFPENSEVSSVLGSSIGGGAIEINEINDIPVSGIDGTCDAIVFGCTNKQKAKRILRKEKSKVESFALFGKGQENICVVNINKTHWSVLATKLENCATWLRYLPALS